MALHQFYKILLSLLLPFEWCLFVTATLNGSFSVKNTTVVVNNIILEGSNCMYQQFIVTLSVL